MEKVIKEFFEGFMAGVKGLFTLLARLIGYGIVYVGGACIVLWLVKTAIALFMALVVLL